MRDEENEEPTPSEEEEWLLQGFRNAAEKRSKSPVQDRFLRWLREAVEDLLRDRDEDAEVVSTLTNDSFREYLFRNYFCPIANLVGHSPNWAQIGERVGAHGVTVQRWLESSPNPKLSTLSMVYAAENATFRCGHAIAIDGYVYAYDGLCRRLGRDALSAPPLSALDVCEKFLTPDDGPQFPQETVEEMLVLYRLFREDTYWLALKENNEAALHGAAKRIAEQVNNIFPCSKQWDLEAIRGTLKARAYEWSVMEAALPFEWF